jgi:quinol monooxygenase YgiN
MSHMIIVSFRILVPPEHHRELSQTIRSLLGQISSQTGCLGTHFYHEDGDDSAVCLIEEWETRADLNNHMRSEIFAVLYGAFNLLRGQSELDFKVLLPQAGIETVEAIRKKQVLWNDQDTDGLLIRY